MAEQQDHNSGGEDTNGDGQHRRQGRHTSTSSTAQTTRAKKITDPSGALPKNESHQ
jgi:hypothetical protein